MITSTQNPLVKQMRKLHRAKERRDQQLFLLEGTHLLEEACAAGCTLVSVCHTAAWQQAYPQLWATVAGQAARVEVVSDEVLQAIATTVHPDGVVATVQRVFNVAQPTAIRLGVALETLQDPGNLGAIIRTAAAAGVDGLWLSANSVDLDHPKVLRASAGQWFRLSMTVSANLSKDVQTLKAQGVQIVATVPTATVVLLGNEGGGLSSELLSLSDVTVKIPLATGVESLNVAIAAALVLYEARRQQSFD
jgi:RNA methyltransferase, TrmH family